MRLRFKPIVLIYLLIISGIYSCYPDKIDSVTEQDIAAAVYDPDAFPGNYVTFSVLDTIVHLTDDGAIPFGAAKEFTDHFSWRGISLDGYRMLDDNLGVGFGFSLQTFVEKEIDGQLEYNNSLISGTQVRYINSIPMLARISYFNEMDMLTPYFTAGIGTVWQERRTDVGTWAITETAWHFALAPEIGVILPAGPTFVTLKVKYMHAFRTSSNDALTYLNFGLGLAW